MPYKCSLEEQRAYRKRYREKNKSRIAEVELPIQVDKRKVSHQSGYCTKCHRNPVEKDRSYCPICLGKQAVNQKRYYDKSKQNQIRK